MKVSHRSRRRITILSGGGEGTRELPGRPGWAQLLCWLNSRRFWWVNTFKGFSMRRRNFPAAFSLYFLFPFTANGFSLVSRPARGRDPVRSLWLSPATPHGYREYRTVPDRTRLDPHPHPHPSSDLLLQLFKCYSVGRARSHPKQYASKIFLIKTYQSTFHITFSKTQQQQQHQRQQQQQLHISNGKVTIVLIIGDATVGTHCAV